MATLQINKNKKLNNSLPYIGDFSSLFLLYCILSQYSEIIKRLEINFVDSKVSAWVLRLGDVTPRLGGLKLETSAPNHMVLHTHLSYTGSTASG